MNKTRIRNFTFALAELIVSVILGLIARHFSENIFSNLSLSFILLINYLFSSLGIAIIGYYYLKYYGKREIFFGALLSSFTFIFFSCVTYILLLSLGINFVFPNSGLIIPLFFGVIGFNIFAFRIK